MVRRWLDLGYVYTVRDSSCSDIKTLSRKLSSTYRIVLYYTLVQCVRNVAGEGLVPTETELNIQE